MMQDNKQTHGGARLGAGRKKGSSVYGESTKAIRITDIKTITLCSINNSN